MPGLSDLLPLLAAPGKGVIMTMGKGGVGKTTIAAAIAVQLAQSGHEVLLTTTSPAAHVAMSVGDGLPGLRITRIDLKQRPVPTLPKSSRRVDAIWMRKVEPSWKKTCGHRVLRRLRYSVPSLAAWTQGVTASL